MGKAFFEASAFGERVSQWITRGKQAHQRILWRNPQVNNVTREVGRVFYEEVLKNQRTSQVCKSLVK